jgi:hypothetical protein
VYNILGVILFFLPIRTTGQPFLHSCLHFFGLHLSALTMAIQGENANKSLVQRRKQVAEFEILRVTGVRAYIRKGMM